MKIVPISEHFKNGLAVTYNPRNRPFLVESVGAMPYEDCLKAVESFVQLDISTLATQTFPYPQLFVCSDCIIVCTPTIIYEYASSTLTAKLSGLTSGTTWDLLDFKTYIYLTNGKQAVIKDPISKAYSVSSTLPYGTCVCNFNGQVLLGSPNVSAAGAI